MRGTLGMLTGQNCGMLVYSLHKNIMKYNYNQSYERVASFLFIILKLSEPG
jgi:hypothetical protein